jgi:hypothetical protein
VAEQAVGLIPGGEVVSSFLALVGIGLNAASENMADEEAKVPDYSKIGAEVKSYLSKFFTKTRTELDKMLEALFGEDEKGESDTAFLKSVVERMGKLGVRNLDKDTELPIIEILKGGEFLPRLQKNEFKSALQKGFKGMVRDHSCRFISALAQSTS